MKGYKIYITGPEEYYPDGEHNLLTKRYLAEEYGFEVVNIPKNIDFTRDRRHLGKSELGLLEEADIVVGNVNFFRGGEPESGTVFELGAAFAKGKRLYSYTRDRRDVIHRYPVGHYDDKGRIIDEHGMAYFGAHAAGNLMYMIPSKIVEGNFEICLKTIEMDLIEEQKDRGSRVTPRVDHRLKATWPLDGKPRAYLAGFEIFMVEAREVGDKMKEICARYGIEGVFPGDTAVGLDIPGSDVMNEVYARSAYFFDRDQQHIRNCDMIIANLNPYHGHEPDSGTVFECGMCFGLGYDCYGFLSDGRSMIEKIPCMKGEDGIYRDIEGYQVENFGKPLNTMLCDSLELVIGDFEDAVRHAAIARGVYQE